MSDNGDTLVRILIVDDDECEQELMQDCLEQHFETIEVTAVSTAQQCLEQTLGDYSIVLLDYNLPDMAGLDLLAKIRSSAPEVPVVMVTGERAGETAASAIRAGACDYLVKSTDYLLALPVIVEKDLMLEKIKRDHRVLGERLKESNEQIKRKNAQLHESLKRMHEMATRDPLTGLANRRHFQRMLDQLISVAQRYENELSCIMIDLDHYKEVNDTLGHLIGDDLLVLAATVMREQCRQADLPARYGGDEFVILMPYTTSKQAQELAERIRTSFVQALRDRMNLQSNVTMSMGIASVAEHQADDPDKLLSMADTALYAAKEAGRNRVVVYTPALDDKPAETKTPSTTRATAAANT